MGSLLCRCNTWADFNVMKARGLFCALSFQAPILSQVYWLLDRESTETYLRVMHMHSLCPHKNQILIKLICQEEGVGTTSQPFKKTSTKYPNPNYHPSIETNEKYCRP